MHQSAQETYEQDPFNSYTLLVCPPAPGPDRAAGAPLRRMFSKQPSLSVRHHKKGRQSGEVQGNRVKLHCSHKVRRIFTTQHDAFPPCLPFQPVTEGKSAGKRNICSLAYQWQSCPCCLLNTSLPTTHSLLLPRGEQTNRKKVTAVCSVCGT